MLNGIWLCNEIWREHVIADGLYSGFLHRAPFLSCPIFIDFIMTMPSNLVELNAAIKEQEDALAALRHKAQEIKTAEKSGVIDAMRSKIAEYGITAADLKLSTRDNGAAPRVSKQSSEKASPKYRGPEGQLWSGGRGRKPHWVTSLLAAGQSIEQYAIKD